MKQYLIASLSNESLKEFTLRMCKLNWIFDDPDNKTITVPRIGLVNVNALPPEGVDYAEYSESVTTEIINWKITSKSFYDRFTTQEQFIFKAIILGVPIPVPDGEGGQVMTTMPDETRVALSIFMDKISLAK